MEQRQSCWIPGKPLQISGLLEKWAVLIGGGLNHRIGLFDMIMLKDNHIDMAGGIEKAIIRTKDYLRARNKNLKIEIETRSLKEVEEVMRVGGVRHHHAG